MTADRTDVMIEKVQKILNKAERAGTPEEAETFFGKAQELMAKHNIEMTMLRLAGEVDAEEILKSDMIVKRSGFFKPMVQLAVEIGQANNVKVLTKPAADWGKEAGVRFIGFKSDIANTKMLYAALLAHCAKERRNVPDYVKEQEKFGKANAVGKWRVDFSMGYAFRIGQRLREMKRATEKAATDADTTGTLLPALLDKDSAVTKWVEENERVSAGRRNRSKYDPYAMSAGASAANKANLGGSTEVGGSRSALGR